MENKNPMKLRKEELIAFLTSLSIEFNKESTVPELQKLIPSEYLINKESTVPELQKFTVETPVKNFNGIIAGIHFSYGKAEVNEGWILNWFKEKGYKITNIEAE